MSLTPLMPMLTTPGPPLSKLPVASCPRLLLPQQETLAPASAQVKSSPAARLVTPLRPLTWNGVEMSTPPTWPHWPSLFWPQQ